MYVVTEKCFFSFILAFINHRLDKDIGSHEIAVLGVDQTLVTGTLDVLFIHAEQSGQFDFEVFLLSFLKWVVFRPLSSQH